ncbi:hypothetical protein Droror1_Dr00011953 [Drosera rotundifolia]
MGGNERIVGVGEFFWAAGYGNGLHFLSSPPLLSSPLLSSSPPLLLFSSPPLRHPLLSGGLYFGLTSVDEKTPGLDNSGGKEEIGRMNEEPNSVEKSELVGFVDEVARWLSNGKQLVWLLHLRWSECGMK